MPPSMRDNKRMAVDDFVSLREHFEALLGLSLSEMDKRNEQRFKAQERAVDAALESAKEAVLKAENSVEKRLEATNEWRETVEDLIDGCFPKPEAERALKNLEEKIATNTTLVTAMIGERRGTHAGWGYAVGIIGVVAAVVALLVKR
jgi:hypothetical protein